MKNEEIINGWKERKGQIEISEDFAGKVMSQIYRYEQKKRAPLFDTQRLIELISAHPLAEAGLITAGVVTGFVRIVFVVCTFLRT